MFNTTRRWFICILSSILPVLAALWAIHLKWYTNGDVWNASTFLLLGGILIVAFVLSFLNNVHPLRDVSASIPLYWNVMCSKILQTGQKDKIQPRINVLLKQRTWKYLFFRSYLVLVWQRQMDSHKDVKISFLAFKGVSGEVLKTMEPLLVDLEKSSHLDWKFSKSEFKKFPKLTAIFSWPIYQLDAKGNQTGAVIGTVNLDTLAPGAELKIRAKNEKYSRLLREFAELVAKAAS